MPGKFAILVEERQQDEVSATKEQLKCKQVWAIPRQRALRRPVLINHTSSGDHTNRPALLHWASPKCTVCQQRLWWWSWATGNPRLSLSTIWRWRKRQTFHHLKMHFEYFGETIVRGAELLKLWGCAAGETFHQRKVHTKGMGNGKLGENYSICWDEVFRKSFPQRALPHGKSCHFKMQDRTCSLKTSECVLEVYDATCRIPVTFWGRNIFSSCCVNENCQLSY